MKKSFRAHPLMIIKYIKPFSFILVLPVIKGLIQFIISQRITGFITLELIAFMIVVSLAALRCLSFRLEIEEQHIIVKTGVILIHRAVINLKKLSSVQTAQGPIDSIFHATTFRINTEAGQRGKPDFEFKLSTKDSRDVSRLLYGNDNAIAIKFSLFKVAAMAATTSSAVTGMIISVPVINKTGKLLGLAIDRVLLSEINTVSGKLHTYFPPIVNAVTLIFLLSYFIGFLYSLFKYMNFKLLFRDNQLEVRTGVVIRTRTSFKKKCVNDVRIEQSPLMRLVKRFAMKVSIGGYGDSKKESAVIVPCSKHGEIKRQFSLYFPFLSPDGKRLHAARNKKTISRFLFMPAIYFIIIVAIAITLSLIFPSFARMILFLLAVASGLDLYYAYLCMYAYKFGKIQCGENIYAESPKGFRTCQLYCTKDKVGQIKIVRWPPDIKLKTCKIEITVRSESADSIKVKHLDYDQAKSLIYKTFSIGE